MKRQPAGLPVGGQFAEDRKAEPAGSLESDWSPGPHNWADMSEKVPAPVGLENFPGHWAPAGGGVGKDYTSPAGTSLVVVGAGEKNSASNGQSVMFESDDIDSFNLTPNDETPEALRATINQALTTVAIQSASSEVFCDYNNVYERSTVEADYETDGQGNKQLTRVTIGFKDQENDRFLEMTHDYSDGTTEVYDVEEDAPDFDQQASDIERDAILVDLASDAEHRSGDAHQQLFAALKQSFDGQDERFGLD